MEVAREVLGYLREHRREVVDLLERLALAESPTADPAAGRYSVVVEGQAAHAGLDPEGGASAILELSYLVQALFALNDPARGITVNVGTIDGGLSPNVVAPRSTAQVDVRVPTPEDALRVERKILSLDPFTPGVKLIISGRIGRPPMERTPRNRRLGAEIGLDLQEATAGGGSDGNTASLYTATLDGPGASATALTPGTSSST